MGGIGIAVPTDAHVMLWAQAAGAGWRKAIGNGAGAGGHWFVITVYLPNGENFVITFAGTTVATPMDLHLTDEQAQLLVAELDRIIENERYPLSPHVKALREIRAMLKPYPERPDTAFVRPAGHTPFLTSN